MWWRRNTMCSKADTLCAAKRGWARRVQYFEQCSFWHYVCTYVGGRATFTKRDLMKTATILCKSLITSRVIDDDGPHGEPVSLSTKPRLTWSVPQNPRRLRTDAARAKSKNWCTSWRLRLAIATRLRCELTTSVAQPLAHRPNLVIAPSHLVLSEEVPGLRGGVGKLVAWTRCVAGEEHVVIEAELVAGVYRLTTGACRRASRRHRLTLRASCPPTTCETVIELPARGCRTQDL